MWPKRLAGVAATRRSAVVSGMTARGAVTGFRAQAASSRVATRMDVERVFMPAFYTGPGRRLRWHPADARSFPEARRPEIHEARPTPRQRTQVDREQAHLE